MVNSTSSVLSTNANTDLLSSSSGTSGSGSGTTDFADTLATCMYFGTTSDSQSGSSSGTSSQNSTTSASAATSGIMTAAAVRRVDTTVATTSDPGVYGNFGHHIFGRGDGYSVDDADRGRDNDYGGQHHANRCDVDRYGEYDARSGLLGRAAGRGSGPSEYA